MTADDEARLRAIVRKRWRIAVILTTVMTAIYFGFIALVAFDKEDSGELIADGRVSVGIVLGAAVILVAPVMTAFYVRWANRVYDPAVKSLRSKP
jgi:uncharacterized membrane protein (DUF485 family)